MIKSYFMFFLNVLTIASGSLYQEIYFSVDPQENQQAIENTEAFIRCNISDPNGVLIQWQLNDEYILNNSRRFQIDSYLYIKRVDRHLDHGEFKCIATDVFTNYSIESAAGNLRISWLDDNVTVIGDNNVPDFANKFTLKCLVHGTNFTIKWYKNGERIFFGDDKYEEGDDEITFIINDLNINDVGVYSCEATIELDEYNTYSVFSEKNYILKFNLAKSLYPELTHLTSNGDVLRIKNDDLNLKLECKFKNYQKIEWVFNEPLKNSTLHQVYQNGTLVINKVRLKDHGFYKCTANNNENLKIIFAIRLEVLFIHDLKIQPELSNLNIVYVTQSHRKLSIICEHPKIEPFHTKLTSIRWYRGNYEDKQQLASENLDDSGTLEFNEFNYWDELNYTCVAEAGNLIKFKTISIYAVEKPIIIQEPKDVIITGEEDENVKFECKFEIPMQNNSPNVSAFVLNQLYSQLDINWYFKPQQPHYDLNQSVLWKRLENDKILKFIINKNQILSQLDINETINKVNLGYYKCEINNKNFDTISSKAAYLYSNSSRISNGLNQVVIKNDKNVLLNCLYVNYKNTIVEDLKWMLPDNKTFVTLKNKNYFDKVKLLENRSLVILNATKQDFGVYTCIVKTLSGDIFFRHVFFSNDTKIDDTNGPIISKSAIKTRSNLSIYQTLLIVAACATAYLIFSIVLIVFCKRKIFKRKCNTTSTLVRPTSRNFQNRKLPKDTKNVDVSKTLIEDKQIERLNNNELPNDLSEVQMNHHKYDTDHAKVEIKKYLNERNSKRMKLTISSISKLASPSQLSLSTNFTLRSVSQIDSNGADYLKTLKNFIAYGKCSYGDVYSANSILHISQQVKKNYAKRNVVLKVLNNLKDEKSVIEFHRDIEMFSKLKHENVVKLIDICTNKEGQIPNIVILEHSEFGDLKEYLIQKNLIGNFLSVFEKLYICYQISLAMLHFEQRLVIHGDLAARNCVVYLGYKNNPSIHVKVSNLGLHDKYQEEYTYLNRILGNNNLYDGNSFPIPLRWQSPELILESKQSKHSDVWSFGVCCWEIWKDGQMPYDSLSDIEVYQALKNYNLYQLDSLADSLCPIQMWTLMEKCWLESAEMRPSFSNCATILHSLLNNIS